MKFHVTYAATPGVPFYLKLKIDYMGTKALLHMCNVKTVAWSI